MQVSDCASTASLNLNQRKGVKAVVRRQCNALCGLGQNALRSCSANEESPPERSGGSPGPCCCHLLQAPVRHSGHSADGSRGRKGEEQVHKLNMSLVYQHGISGFSGEAKRRSICWWENDWKGIDRSMATCKVAPNDPV